MLIPVIIEPAFQDSHWCRQSINGIQKEAKRKKYAVRFVSERELTTKNDAFQLEKNMRLAIVVGTSISWIPHVLQLLEEQEIQAILINYDSFESYIEHSVVRMDYVKAMRRLIGYFNYYGRRNIACFGFNPNSSADRIKESYFLSAMAVKGDPAPQRHVFHSCADIRGCFEQFIPHAADYDALICANDIVAVSASKMFISAGIRVPEDMFIVGFGESILSEKVTPSITTVNLDHEQMGQCAVLLFSFLSRQETQNTASVRVESQLIIRASTHYEPFTIDMLPEAVHETVASVDFYQDPEVKRLQTIEDFYYHADELDQQILVLLQKNVTLEAIAERCSASVSTIGYRIRNMQNRANVSTRQKLLKWLENGY